MFKFNFYFERKRDSMSGLEELEIRLGYAGGNRQISRMNKDKLRSLKKALLYSYQSATAILKDGREFRCLINPDRIKNQYDNKIISIPFEDICLNEESIQGKTSEGVQEIGMKPGDVFTWKENGTDWLVYLRRLEETAYFRAEIRRCDYEIEVGNQKYKVYAARTEVNEIDWRNEKDENWNDIDYKINMYITKDENTQKNLHRFTIVWLAGRPWEVQAIDDISSEGIIILNLKEYYNNTIEKELKDKEDEQEKPEDAHILGDYTIYPYDKKTYSIADGISGGVWEVDSNKIRILEQTETNVTIEVLTGKSGSFNLKYIRENEEDIVAMITIKSL